MLPLWFRANSVAFRCCRCGFARLPHFDAPAVVSREFRPLVASSGLFCGGLLRLPTATARAVGRVLFDAPAVVSRKFRCVSMLLLRFRANSVAFRCSAVVSREFRPRGLFRPLLGGPLRLPTATARAVRRGLGFDAPAALRFDAPAVVSRESVAFRYSPCGFARIPASRGLFRPLLGGPLSCRPQRCAR